MHNFFGVLATPLTKAVTGGKQRNLQALCYDKWLLFFFVLKMLSTFTSAEHFRLDIVMEENTMNNDQEAEERIKDKRSAWRKRDKQSHRFR